MQSPTLEFCVRQTAFVSSNAPHVREDVQRWTGFSNPLAGMFQFVGET